MENPTQIEKKTTKKQFKFIFTVEMDARHMTKDNIDTIINHCQSELAYGDATVLSCIIEYSPLVIRKFHLENYDLVEEVDGDTEDQDTTTDAD